MDARCDALTTDAYGRGRTAGPCWLTTTMCNTTAARARAGRPDVRWLRQLRSLMGEGGRRVSVPPPTFLWAGRSSPSDTAAPPKGRRRGRPPPPSLAHTANLVPVRHFLAESLVILLGNDVIARFNSRASTLVFLKLSFSLSPSRSNLSTQQRRESALAMVLDLSPVVERGLCSPLQACTASARAAGDFVSVVLDGVGES